MKKWAIKAVFSNEEGESNFTYYEEKQFWTRRGAIRAINDNYGESLAEAATLDCQIDEDLDGFWLEDLDVYKVEGWQK
jgi:hypothetical protein